jgi:serine/threonine-protein kinase
VTLYESLTGHKPFRANTSFSVLNAHLNEAPVPPIEVNAALSPELNSIVLRALAKNPDDRFQTAQEFHDALKALVDPTAPRPALLHTAQPPAFMPVPASAGVPSSAAPSVPSATSAISGGFTPVPTNVPPPAEPGAVAPPPFAPIAAAKPVSPPAKSHRGLWIGMGALAAILALVAIAWALPHLYSTYAKQKAIAPTQEPTAASATNLASNPVVSPQPETPTPNSTPPANPTGEQIAPASPNPSGGTAPVESQGKTPSLDKQPKDAAHAQSTGAGSQHQPVYSGSATQVKGNGTAGTAVSSGTDAPAQATISPSVPAGPSPQEIREARDRLMNLEARADAAREGVQNIRSQQQAQGLDMRGDILAALSRMNNSLREARAAINRNDLDTANQYIDHADKATARLETFLGK